MSSHEHDQSEKFKDAEIGNEGWPMVQKYQILQAVVRLTNDAKSSH